MRFFCAAAVLCLVTGCGGGGGGAGGDSPQDAFNKIKNGFQSGNYDAALRCVDPDSHDQMLFGTMLVVGFATMGKEGADAEVKGILQKHGVKTDKDNEDEKIDLSDEGAMKKAMAKTFKDVKDKPALFHELMKVAEKYTKQTNALVPENAELKDVKIEGDTATGTISSEKGDNEAKFVKKDGRWYAKFD